MDTIGELIVAFFSFVFHALLLVIEAILAVFSPLKRNSLKQRWNGTRAERLEIIFGLLLLLALVIGILFIVSKFTGCSSTSNTHNSHQSVQLTGETNSEEDKIEIEINLSDEMKEKLKDKALDFLKEKWENK